MNVEIKGKFSKSDTELLTQAAEKLLDNCAEIGSKMSKPWFWTGNMKQKFEEYAVVKFDKASAGKVNVTFTSYPYGHGNDIQNTADQFKMVTSFLLGQMQGAAIAHKRPAPSMSHDSDVDNVSLSFSNVRELVQAVNTLQTRQENKIDIPEQIAK